MRGPIFSQPLAAVGTAVWSQQGSLILPLDYIQLAFGVSAGGILSQDASAITYSFYLTLDDCSPDGAAPAGVSQTTTTITVTDPALQARGGVAAGDIVQLRGFGSSVDGWYPVATAPSLTTYTVTSLVSQTFAGGGMHQYWRLFAAPTLLTAATTRVFTNLAHSTTGPCTGLCLKTSARTAGSLVGIVVQGAGPG